MRRPEQNQVSEGNGRAEAHPDEEPPGEQVTPVVYLSTDASVLAQFPAGTIVPYPTRTPQLPRGIVVLHSQTDQAGPGEPKDILADLETATTAQAIAQVLREHARCEVHVLPVSLPVESRLAPYPPEEYVVFNLFEGIGGVVGDEASAAFTLETLGYRFTGARSHALTLAADKARTARILANCGMLTPAWRVFGRPDEVSLRTLGDVDFPLIVRPVATHSSLGIDLQAVVNDLDSLRARVAYVVEKYQQQALVSAFIDGREFNAAIWGDPPEVLPLAEVDFSAIRSPNERILSFAAKWEYSSLEYRDTPVICPALTSDGLAARLRATALRVYEVTGCSGYARVDMRVKSEDIYVLEVNPNPSLAPDAGFARAARVAGYDYAQMILKILSFIREGPYVPGAES